MDIEIQQPQYFSYLQCLGYIDRGFDECLYNVKGKRITQATVINGEQILMEVDGDEEVIHARVLTGGGGTSVNDIEKYIRSWLDLDRDMDAFYNQQDPMLKALINRYSGLRLVGIENLFETLCWSIIGQQINLTFAYKLKRALVEKFGTYCVYEGEQYYFFPTPEVLAGATKEDLLALQFSKQKADYVINLAQIFSNQEISKADLQRLTLTQAVDRLSELRGIGPWTANYVAMRCLKFMEAFPMGDAGLQNAIKYFSGSKEKPSIAELLALSEKWKGWQAYATLFLWRSLGAS